MVDGRSWDLEGASNLKKTIEWTLMESNLLSLVQGQGRQMKIGKYSSKRQNQRATIQVPWV